MTKFLYQLDDRRYRLPWTDVDRQRLRLWFIDLHLEIGQLKGHEIYLFGGSWAANSRSLDLDLFLTPTEQEIDVDNHGTMVRAYQILSAGYRLALDEHRFLIDFTYTNLHRLMDVFEEYKEFEAGTGETITGETINPETSHEPGMGIVSHYRKIRNGTLEIDTKNPNSGVIDLGQGRRFYRKPRHPVLRKQMQYIRDGRVYHPPIALKWLVG